MQISEIMKKEPRCISQDMTVRKAAELMQEIDCGVLPVLKDRQSNKPIGVLTDRDIVVRCVAEGGDCETRQVSEILTEDPVTCDLACSVADAFERMRSEKVGRLLVTDASGQLVGIVSMADIIARVPREIFNQLPGAEQSRPRQRAA